MTLLWTTSSFGTHDLPDDVVSVGNPLRRTLTEKEAAALLAETNPDAVIAGVEPLSRFVLSAAPALRVISRCGVGTDNIDLSAAGELKIKVCTATDAHIQSVAELTIGLILSLLRWIPHNDRRVRSGRWQGPGGSLLRGKCVGIIGCGRIGTTVGRLLTYFGATLVGYDPKLDSHTLIRLLSLDEVFRTSDIVTIHASLTESNRGFIDERRIRMMKPGSWLVNTSRGGLVDERALESALASGHLAGAAVDVFESEPYHGPLTASNSTVLSPHTGARAAETRREMERQAIANAIDLIRRS